MTPVDGDLQALFDRGTGDTLSLDTVSIDFGGVRALSEVGFEIDGQHVAALIGPNGAGKSTLLNTICGLTVGATARGEIRLGDYALAGMRPATRARLGVARSFQHPRLIESESVLENVMVGQHLRLGYSIVDQMFRRGKVKRAEADGRERAMTVMAYAGLERYRDRPVRELAYGFRKLIDIARALVSGPRLLLLDEPTSGLDRAARNRVSRLLTELRENRCVTVLVAEHHMDVVRAVADTVVGLHSGRILQVGAPAAVLNSAEFRAALTGVRAATELSSDKDSVGDQTGMR